MMTRVGRWSTGCWGVVCALGNLLAANALAAGPSGEGPALAQVAYEPVALHWSAVEVERATANNFDAIVARAQRQGLLGCERSCARVQPIFERLLPLARAQTAHARHLPWSLTVVRSADVEAMALPGGQVVVSEIFITRHRLHDDALAFVLAHEMAHSILEHERQTLHFARMLLRQDVSRSVADMYVEIGYSFALLSALEPVLQQGELEADELGLLLASAAGYSPRRQLDFFAQQAGQEKAARPLVQTHPPMADRLQQLRLRLPLAQRLHAQAMARLR